MQAIPVHLIFDLLAVVAAVGMTGDMVRRGLIVAPGPATNLNRRYFAALGLGVVLGSFVLGTANLWLSGEPGVGRSIIGALAGGIAMVEFYKHRNGISGSTGLLFVPAFATLVVVGRIGCALSGLEDHTYGTPTRLPWGQDFGDGILRHPVAVYESLSMASFLALALVALIGRWPFFRANGFYLMVGFYALQRFAWEFLKPYATLIGPMNLFHLTAGALFFYAVMMMRKARP
jgi:phosphatidylglycerol---prolipoprotein diacylglyceryl transferase